MSPVDRMIDQTFVNANVDQKNYPRMVIGVLKAVDGQKVQCIVLVDNGLLGKKLVALTTRRLTIIDEAGNTSDQWPVNDLENVQFVWNALKITYRLKNGLTSDRIFNPADRDGLYDLANRFSDLQPS